MRNEIYGRCPIAKSRNPFTCGLTGKTYTVRESHQRSDLIAKALSKVMGWEPNADLPWDKVVCVFAFNTVSLSATDQTHGELPDSPLADRLPLCPARRTPSVRHRDTCKCCVFG